MDLGHKRKRGLKLVDVAERGFETWKGISVGFLLIPFLCADEKMSR